jgi:hypothetical protein
MNAIEPQASDLLCGIALVAFIFTIGLLLSCIGVGT